ncbi:MAG: sodium:solute symporter, partial [Prevotella sp.]|nr:sodium:solute symporter [Prevotella sp.]
NDKLVPLIAILSPVLCFLIDYLAESYLAYKFSYEMLLLNGALTFFGMFIVSEKAILKEENICGH